MMGFLRNPRRVLIVVHDLAVTALAMLATLYIRFGDGQNGGLTERFHWLVVILPCYLVYAGIVYWYFHLYMAKWRFASLPDLRNIFRAVSVLAISLFVLDYILLYPALYGTFFFGKITIALYWFLQMFFLGGPRIAYRLFRLSRTQQQVKGSDAIPTLIVGRAADAEVLLRAIESGAVKNVDPVGILSPSPADQDQELRGVPVRGFLTELDATVLALRAQGKRVERLVLTPSALEPELHPETMLMVARRLGLAASRMPSLGAGEEALRLAPVNVEDLLLRPSVRIDYRRLESFIEGKTVVVTGGGGSIGSEICDRVVTFSASRLLVIENSEPALHAVLERLADKSSKTVVEGRIADIRDRERIFRLIAEFKPNLVFHAAALKHVPLLERDWDEGIKTNVFGSVNVADAALSAGADAMVMISTDKAIDPVSVLGATKRLAEMYCQGLDAGRGAGHSNGGKPPMRMIAVRFGNVLASNGSVIPKFKAQIEAGGPGDRDASRHGALLHDDSRSVRSRHHGGKPCARAGAVGYVGLCSQYGPADQDRRSRRTAHSFERARAGTRRRHRFHRHTPRRTAQRDPVLKRGGQRGYRHRRRRRRQAGLSADRGGAGLDRQVAARS